MRSIFTSELRAWSAVSAFVALIMLPNLIWICVGYESTAWILGLLVPAFLLTLLFAVFGKKIWLACIFLAPFAVLAPVEAMYVATYQQTTNAEILATLFATTPQETYEYLGSSLAPVFLCITGSLLLTALTVCWAQRAALQWAHPSRRWVITSTVILLIVGVITTLAIPTRLNAGARTASEIRNLIEPGYPFGLLPRIAKYHSEWKLVREGGLPA